MAQTETLLETTIDKAAELADIDIPDSLTQAPDQVKSPDELFWLDPLDSKGVKQPWARYDDEPAKAFALFQFYCSLPRAKRSYVAVDRHYDLTPTANKCAHKYEWADRTLAWDLERDRLYQIEVVEEMQEMGRRHGKQLTEAIEAVAIPLKHLADRIKKDPDAALAELDEKSITQLHSMSVKSANPLSNLMAAERLARGLPTEITANIISGKVEHVHTPDLSEVADIIQGLHAAGAIEFVGSPVIDVGEEADAEIEPLSEDDPDDETDGLSSSQ